MTRSADIAVGLWVSCLPLLAWLVCGVVVGVVKKWVRDVLRTKAEQTNDKNAAAPYDSARDNSRNDSRSTLIVVLTDTSLICVETALHALRIVVSLLPVFIFLWVSFVVSVVILRHGPDVIFVIDTAYESIRPNVVDTVLHVLNFSRTLYALAIGVWNALIDLLLIPVRLLFDSAFQCGGTEFIQTVADAGADVARGLANALYEFFVNWNRDDLLDTDVTAVVASVRRFLQAFTDVIECSCETVGGATTRAIAHPLFSKTTDVFINNATRAVLKTAQIPYTAMVTGSTSFDPLFEILLNENSGVLASGAALGNEYAQAIVQFVQIGVPRESRFDAPPLSSLLHRYLAVFVELARVLVSTIAAVPTLVTAGGREVANEAHDASSMTGVKFQANAFFDVLFVHTLAVIHETWREYGSFFATSAHAVTETMETAYDFFVDAAVGVHEDDYRVTAPTGADGKLRACAAHIVYSGDVLTRVRIAFIVASERYADHVVPLQVGALEIFRRIVGVRFLSTALAETMFAGGLFVVRYVEAWANLNAYLIDALLRVQPVTALCIQDFQAPAWEKLDDTLTSLPNLVTSMFNIDETNDSGYANLVCARSTHVNHIYSGSLKAYVFASKACRTRYDGTNVVPKCAYRHENSEEQARLCEKLVAFADYNTNPLCNTGDVLIEAMKSFVLQWRTLNDYQVGMLVGVWGCLADATTNDFASCGSELSGEFVPSAAIFDLLQCQVTELVYRVTVAMVSMWGPLFEAVYLRTGYPSQGYYATGADDVTHVQARPLEAAFATLLTSFGGMITYPTYVFAESGRDLSIMFSALVAGSFNPAAFFAYRYKIVITALRALVLFFRDVLIGVVQFARAADTVAHYNAQPVGQKDPTQTTDTFKAFQSTVGKLVGLIQDIAELLTEPFVRGIEAFFDVIFSLLGGLLNGDGEAIADAFEKFVNVIAHVIVDMIEAIFKMLIADYGGVNPFRFLFCDVLGAMKDGTCEFMQFNFIPYKFKLKCHFREKGCSWLPDGEITMFDASGNGNEMSATGTSVSLEAASASSRFTSFNFDENSDYGVALDGATALQKYGFLWNEYYGDFDPNNEYHVITRSNAKREDPNAYDPEHFCEFIKDPARCDFFNTLDFTLNQASTNLQEHWASVKSKCDEPRRCAERYDSGKCKSYINACTWIPENPENKQFRGTLRYILEMTLPHGVQALNSINKNKGLFWELYKVGDNKGGLFFSSLFEDGVKKFFVDFELMRMLEEPLFQVWLNELKDIYVTAIDEETFNPADSNSKSPTSLYIKGAHFTFEDSQLLPYFKGTCKSPGFATNNNDEDHRLTRRVKYGTSRVRKSTFTVGGEDHVVYYKVLFSNSGDFSAKSGAGQIGQAVRIGEYFPECLQSPPPPPTAANGRRLLGSGKDVANAVASPFKQAGNDIYDSIKWVAEEAKKKANDAANLARDAKNFAVDAANDVANQVTDTVNWIERAFKTFKESIPDGTKFSISATSIAAATKLNIGPPPAGMGCTDASGVKTSGFALCRASDGGPPPSQEPTVCSSEAECHATDATCWTIDETACLDPRYDKTDALWAKSCACSLLAERKYHCNFASGYCEAGATPFAPPLDECSAADGLVAGSDAYDRLCYISPLWKCAGAEDVAECRSSIGGVIALQGPSLCRTFCDPTFENRNNKLAQYQFLDGTRKCVCEVGWDRVAPDGLIDGSTPADVVNIPVAFDVANRATVSVTGRRRLAEAASASSASVTRPFTHCSSAAQCRSTLASTAICRSLWGDPIPCYSCSERVHGESGGYKCDPEEKECTCAVVRDNEDGDFVDIGEWRGNAWCDKIMRGYKTTAVRSPLEQAWIHRCTVLKALGRTIADYLGLSTIPPDFLYNPSRFLVVLGDVVEGVNTYYSERWDAEKEDFREAFFDRLVEKHVDPIVTFKALQASEYVWQVLGVFYEKVDVIGTTRVVLGAIDEDARDAFDEAVAKTSEPVAKVMEAIRTTDYGAIAAAIGATGSAIKNLTTIALAKDANATTANATTPLNATTTANATTTVNATSTDAAVAVHHPNTSGVDVYDGDVDVFAPARHLLTLSEQCVVIANVRDRVIDVGDFLTEYYGTSGAYLSATLCAYETFLGSRTGCDATRGQSFSEPLDVTDGLPFLGVGNASTTISVDDLLNAALGATGALDRWFDRDADTWVSDIVEATSAFFNGVVKCDADVLLCKKRERSLLSAAFIVETYALLMFLSFKAIGINSLGLGLFITAQLTVVPMIIMNLAYNLPLSCFPRVPVCLGDDAFELLLSALPRHVKWPSLLVTPHRSTFPDFPWLTRLDRETHIENCRDHGFNNIFDAYFWAREYTEWKAVFGALDWPLITFSASARRTADRWESTTLSTIVNQCGTLNAVGFFPPAIFSIVFYLLISFIAVPVIKFAIKILVVVGARVTFNVYVYRALNIYNE